MNIDSLSFYNFKNMNLFGDDIIISRTGYTGELGYEIYSNNITAEKIWDTLISDQRILPAGLGARDLLRLEMGYSLYGNEIDENTTPLEAKLDMFVDFNKEFIGKAALLEQKSTGVTKTKIAFVSDTKRIPRNNHRILSDNKEAGHVTSGGFSPHKNAGIGLGYIIPELDVTGTEIIICDERSNTIPAKIVNLPFYNEGTLRN